MASIDRVNSIEAIAKGGVGCIITPALQCINSQEPNDRTRVSKLFTSEEEYKQELASSEELEEKLGDVKNRSNFFLYKATDCRLDAVQKERLNKKQIKIKCINEYISGDPVYVLNYDYGGESIESILQKSSPKYIINNVLLNLHNLFKGVIILNKHLIYHLDLSTDNVLLSQNKKMKIIDFGRCFIADDEFSFNTPFIKAHFSKKGSNFGKPMYVAPELMATIAGGQYMVNQPMFKNTLYTERAVNTDYIESLKEKIKNSTLFLKQCFEKADVWALGAILFTIRNKFELKNKALNTLIDDFTNIDLNQRADCYEAYILYKKFVKDFKRQSFVKRGSLLTSSPTSSPELSPNDTSFTLSPTTSPLSTPSTRISVKEVGGKRIKRRKTKKRRNKKRRKLTRRT